MTIKKLVSEICSGDMTSVEVYDDYFKTWDKDKRSMFLAKLTAAQMNEVIADTRWDNLTYDHCRHCIEYLKRKWHEEEQHSDNNPKEANKKERIINEEELRNYFKNDFCGVKPSTVNYFKYLIDDLKIDRNGKDAACIAKLIYESKHMTNKPNTFSAWHRAFCNLADFPYVEYRPNKINTDKIKDNFRYLL